MPSAPPPADAAAIAAARQCLAALAAAEAYGHDELAALTHALDIRIDPDRRRHELAEVLVAPTLPATVDFRGSRLLGQSNYGTPDYLDWIAVFGRTPDQPEASWFEHFAVDQVWKTDADALVDKIRRMEPTGSTVGRRFRPFGPDPSV